MTMNGKRWRGDPDVPRAARAVAGALGAGIAIALLTAPWFEARANDATGNASAAQATWRAALPRTPIHSVKPVDAIPGLVEIVSGTKIFYGDAAGKVLLIGNLYDVRANRDLTQARADALATQTRVPWNAPPEGAIAMGQGGAEALIFMDPHCGWCRKLFAELATTTSLRAQLLLLPLSDGSAATARSVLCDANPAKALARVYAGDKLKVATCQAADRAIAAAATLARTYGINATPAMVSRDGRMRLGYQPVAATLAWLAATRSDSATPKSITETRTP